MSAKTLAIWKVLIASCLWGYSGVAAQQIFAQGFEPGWLVTLRMLVAGGVLTVLGLARGNSTAIFRHPKDAVKLLVFAILGMATVQYTFFAAIKYGNAATATFLQYLSPVMVAAYQTVKEPWLLNRKLVLSIAAALTGVFMLVTGGSFSTLQVSGECVTWGLLSAVALSFYVLYPGALLKRYGTMNLVGWAMLIGGLALFYSNPAAMFVAQKWSANVIALIAGVAIFGTLIPFCLFVDSLQFLTATESSLLSCAEPLAAAIISAAWLQMAFGPGTWVGAFFIVTSVLLLTVEINAAGERSLPQAASAE